MTAQQIARRQRAVASAIGSVRAEGLNPSTGAQKRLNEYAQGKITSAQLRSATLKSIKAKHSK